MGWRLSVSGLVRLVAAATCGTLLVVGCSASPAVDPAGGGDQGSFTMLPPAQRQAAPLITGDTLEGRTWRSDAVKDKVIVYNVWGSWCAPCVSEAPALVAASKRTRVSAVFMGINVRDPSMAAPRAFVRTEKIPYDSLFDPDGALLLKFSGQLPPSAIPSTLVIDRQGRIAARIIGETNEATLVGVVEDVAAGK